MAGASTAVLGGWFSGSAAGATDDIEGGYGAAGYGEAGYGSTGIAE